MKKLFFSIALSVLTSFVFAQIDIVWGITTTTGNSSQLKKFTGINANTGLTFSNPTG